MKTVLARLLRLFLTLLFSFSGVFFGFFNILFSERFGFGQQAESYFFVFALYGIFGFILALPWPQQRMSIWLWLATPVFFLTAVLILLDPLQVLTIAGVASFVVLGIWLGSAAGLRVAQKRTHLLPQTKHV